MPEPGSTEIPKKLSSEIKFKEHEFKLAIGETVKLPSMEIGQMKLYHGSPTLGISQFKEAEETTIGNGVYLTSSPDVAKGYAFIRSASDKSTTKTPTVYESQIEGLDILSLTTREALMSFMKYFRQELFYWTRDILPNLPQPEYMIGRNKTQMLMINQKLWEAIQKNKVLAPKDYLMGAGTACQYILQKDGFDGLMTMEGGEYGQNPFTGENFHIGDHDSYVIFNPEKAKIIKEERIPQTKSKF